MRLTLRTKVILTVSLFLVAVFALIMYLSVNRNVNQLRSNLNEQAKSFAALATPPIGNTFLLYKDSGSIKITQQVDKLLALEPDVSNLRIVSVDGTQLYSSQKGRSSSIPADLASSFKPKYLETESHYIHEIVQPFFEDSNAHRYSVVYDISTKRVEKSVTDAARLIIYADIVILVISIIAASIALNILFIKPLREVSRSADIISAGNYDQQIISKNTDEIGKLSQAVNRMANALKEDITKLRDLDKLKSEFMMIASHNLRTPITIIQGYIDLAKQVESSSEEVKKIINTIEESVVRLHLLAENVLTVSTIETSEMNMEKSEVQMNEFIEAINKEFGLLAMKKNIKWEFKNDIPAETKLNISHTNMRSALSNLVDNAIKFTKPDGLISVVAKIEGSNFVFSVKDTGIGISKEEIPKLFMKFHRGTGTLHYDYEGIGIGLYLSKLIIEEHKGSISVESKLNQGSTFTVHIPMS